MAECHPRARPGCVLSGAMGMAVTRLWGQYPKVAVVLHTLILLLLASLFVVELLTRKDRFLELVEALASVATASTLIVNSRRAMRNGWRGPNDIVVEGAGDQEPGASNNVDGTM